MSPKFLAFSAVLAALSACQADPAASPNDLAFGGGAGVDANAAGSGASGQGTGAAAGGEISGGAAGNGASAGTPNAGGAAGQSSGGLGGAGGSGGALVDLPPIQECMGTPSVDRFTQWIASGEGTTVPAKGSILVMDAGEYVAKVEMVGAGWHVVPVYIKNKFGEALDLSASSGITLTYSATAELHVQLRSKSHWSGGQQYATTIPATGGKKETRFFSFAEPGWKSLFGPPALSYADTLKEGMGLVFVGDGPNSVVFYGMRIDGYTPPCP
jgi:hypothetical protein